MTWLVIAIALALPATLYVGVSNLQALGQRWDGGAQLSVFINPKAKPQAIESLRLAVSQDERVAELTYVSARAGITRI